MSQHSDATLVALLRSLAQGGDTQNGFVKISTATLRTAADAIEAAKPAPGGPKMREVKISVIHNKGEGYEPLMCFQYPHGGAFAKFPKGLYTITALVPEPPEPTVPEVPARVDGEGE